MEASPAVSAPPVTAPATRGWAHSALLTRGARLLGLGVMVASVLLPATGRFGIDLCFVHASTGLPCPGCGMTRAIIAVSHGHLATALGLHPFVVLAWPLFFGLAVLALLPSSVTARLDAWLNVRGRWLGRVYQVLIFAFVGFGVLRFAVFAALRQQFP